MNVNTIRSIGWLNCADGSINLTPVFEGSGGHAVMANISKSEFENIHGDKDLMKLKAVEVLSPEWGKKSDLMASYNYDIKLTHIDLINPGCVVEHNGKHMNVCKNDLKMGGFMGTTLFGDSYHSGYKPVRQVIIQTPQIPLIRRAL